MLLSQSIGQQLHLAFLPIDVRIQQILVLQVAADFASDARSKLAHQLRDLSFQVAVLLLNVVENCNDQICGLLTL